MVRPLAAELELDKVMTIVAAHAQTRLGRQLLTGADGILPPDEGLARARLTAELDELLDGEGRLSLAGVDDAAPWLEDATPPPREAEDLLCLLALARRIASTRRRLLASPERLVTVRTVAAELPDTSALVDQVGPLLGRDGRVPDGASPELARLRAEATRIRTELLGELEAIRRSHPELVGDAPPTVRRDRYCLPVRASLRARLPGLVLDSSGSGATAFVEPFAVVELNNGLVNTLARAGEEVDRILAEAATAFAAMAVSLRKAISVLARIDAAQARALFGRRIEGRIVTPHGRELILCAARHPLLDERLAELRRELFGAAERRQDRSAVVPLDLRLPDGVRTLVVSGPNAGGKTVVLKTIGLLVLMASHGVPISVAEGASIPEVNELWCHIGDEQDVAADLSTFSATMRATAGLLASSDASSLVLYDELGSGTDPLEGAALGCALLEELTRRRCLTVATTHLAAIAMAATATEGVDNAAMEYDEERERPTYRLRLGRPGRSRALEIARATGLPAPILERARELLGGHHLELDRWLRRLERAEADTLEERHRLGRERHELARLTDRLDDQRRRLEEEHGRLLDRLAEEREQLRRRAKDQLDAAIARLDAAIAAQRALGRRARQRLRDEALDLPPVVRAAESPPRLEPGAAVRLVDLDATGVLVEIRGSRALVTADGKRLWVELERLQLASQPGPSARARVAVTVDETPPTELNLLGLDREAARDELERFLDRAMAAGTRWVRVVHGHGTGALRRVVAEVCRGHPGVRSFAHPAQARGGSGVTEVELEAGP